MTALWHRWQIMNELDAAINGYEREHPTPACRLSLCPDPSDMQRAYVPHLASTATPTLRASVLVCGVSLTDHVGLPDGGNTPFITRQKSLPTTDTGCTEGDDVSVAHPAVKAIAHIAVK